MNAIQASITSNGKLLQTVEYFALDAAPGIKVFRCDKLRATLTVHGCAQNYRTALTRTEQAERLHGCRNCAVGGLHTGQKPVRLSQFYGQNICCRCTSPASRIINSRLCVSCQNREYEIVKGRNAKGQPPVKLQPLHPRRISVSVEGLVSEFRLERSSDTAELMLAVLRNKRGDIAFGFPPGRIRTRQLRLFG
jgi:hypothetical protein